MQFTVPKFIDREAKIIGPFTFKQFLYLSVPGAICFMLYFTVPFPLFIILAVILMGGALCFALIKIEGRSIPVILKNSLIFFSSSKLYIWKRKSLPPRMIKKENVKPKEEKIAPIPRVTESKLKGLATKIETRT